MPARLTVLRAGLMAGVLLLAACAAPPMDDSPDDGSAPAPATADPTGAQATGSAAPETLSASPSPAPRSTERDSAEETEGARLLAFQARGLEGGTVDASQLVGRDVILWMWAPW